MRQPAASFDLAVPEAEIGLSLMPTVWLTLLKLSDLLGLQVTPLSLWLTKSLLTAIHLRQVPHSISLLACRISVIFVTSHRLDLPCGSRRICEPSTLLTIALAEVARLCVG